MTEPVFVDTNVFLYALDKANSLKQEVARSWTSLLWTTQLGRVSFQVLGEFYVNAMRFGTDSIKEAREEIRDLLAWHPVTTDAALLDEGWRIQDRYHLSYWDALIVAASKTASCRYLLTEDLQAGQNLSGVEGVNPFTTEPRTLL